MFDDFIPCDFAECYNSTDFFAYDGSRFDDSGYSGFSDSTLETSIFVGTVLGESENCSLVGSFEER